MAKREAPKLPRYNVCAVERLRDRLFGLVLRHAVGAPVTQDAFQGVVVGMCAVLPPGCDVETVRMSNLDLLGRPLTTADAYAVAWRMAGNVATLRRDVPVPAWSQATELLWVPGQVVDVIKGTSRFGEYGLNLHLVALAGPPAGERFVSWHGRKFASYLAGDLGFSRRRDKKQPHPYRDGTELTGMRMHVRMGPQAGGKPWDNFWVTGTYRARNRVVLEARRKVTPPCPIGADWPCWTCHVGTDRCMAACHENTYTERACARCGRTRLCDPTAAHGMCLACASGGS